MERVMVDRNGEKKTKKITVTKKKKIKQKPEPEIQPDQAVIEVSQVIHFK